MPREMIMTRKDVLAEAVQFEGTQKNVDEITEWVNEYTHEFVVMWNGNDRAMSGDIMIEAEPGLLELYPQPRGTIELAPMEAVPGDWVVKSSRDTFYTVAQEDFNEIWEVMR